MGDNLASRMLETLIMWTAPIAMIVLIIFLIKDVKDVMSGQGAIGKIIVKIVCVLLLVGVMFAAGSFESFGKVFQGVVEDVVTEENLPDIGK